MCVCVCVAMKLEGRDLFVYFFQLGTRVIFAVIEIFYVIIVVLVIQLGFPGGSEGKASACNAGNWGSIPGSGRPPGEGNGNPLRYSCLENPMDGETW